MMLAMEYEWVVREAFAFGIWVAVVACAPKPPGESPAPAVSVGPTPSAAPAAPPPSAAPPAAAAAAGPFAEPALPRNPNDLSWLTTLVKVLSEKPVTREQVIEYLGQDAGADTGRAGMRRVQARSQYLDSIKVYPLAHIRIEVAIDISFAKDGRPSRGTMQSALGPLQPMPRAPDDFSSGPKLAYYEKGAYGTVRVFVELDKANDPQVAAVHVDVDGVAR